MLYSLYLENVTVDLYLEVTIFWLEEYYNRYSSGAIRLGETSQIFMFMLNKRENDLFVSYEFNIRFNYVIFASAAA